MKQKTTYLLIVISVIILGILSRKFDFFPLFIGDVLYAVLIYFTFSLLFPTKNRAHILLISLLICFTIEISQLIKWNWLNTIRSTTFGHYVLGERFLWEDLLCYVIGVSGKTKQEKTA